MLDPRLDQTGCAFEFEIFLYRKCEDNNVLYERTSGIDIVCDLVRNDPPVFRHLQRDLARNLAVLIVVDHLNTDRVSRDAALIVRIVPGKS